MKKNLLECRYIVNRQSGVTLVEVLVTVLILAVGSLGIASLQLAGLKYSSGSYARTQVTILSDDMANRIKSNRAIALTGAVSPYELSNFTGTTAVTRDCITDVCTAEQFADYDIATWANEVARAIPSGQGRVIVTDRLVDGVNDRQFSIQLQWRQVANSTDQQGSDNDEVKSVAYRISL